MNLRPSPTSEALCPALLQCAGLLVPHALRAEWLAGWISELWYVRQSRPGAVKAFVFCLGAFKDALWVRRNNPVSPLWPISPIDSPLRCVLFLACLAAASGALTFFLPGVANAFLPSPYRDPRALMMISPARDCRPDLPGVRLDRYRLLANAAHPPFTGLAFYAPLRDAVEAGPRGIAFLSVARASRNLFDLLEAPVALPSSALAGPARPTQLILSRAAWRKFFHSDPRIAGRVLAVAGQPAQVAGVLSENFWRLPGKVDAWLFEDESGMASLPPSTPGFVIARVGTVPLSRSSPWRRMSVQNSEGRYEWFEAESWAAQRQRPIFAFLLMSLAACIVLPATTSLSLGEYPADRASHPWARRLRQWMFLGVKIALLFPILYFGSLDFLSPVMQPQGLLVGFTLAFRWALIDQRQRCPVCLRRLTNPVRVSSGGFLGWHGTELVCARGHGLLHVPDIPASWFSTQRWLRLDPSWSGLFS